MFGNPGKAISAYQKVSVDAAVEVADPHRLIILLFEGAQAAIGKARAMDLILTGRTMDAATALASGGGTKFMADGAEVFANRIAGISGGIVG